MTQHKLKANAVDFVVRLFEARALFFPPKTNFGECDDFDDQRDESGDPVIPQLSEEERVDFIIDLARRVEAYLSGSTAAP